MGTVARFSRRWFTDRQNCLKYQSHNILRSRKLHLYAEIPDRSVRRKSLLDGMPLQDRDSFDVIWNRMERVFKKRIVGFMRRRMETGELRSKEMLILILHKLRKSRRYKDAFEVSNWVVNEKPFPPVTDMDRLYQVDFAALVGEIGMAERLFYRLPAESQTELGYHFLLSAYVRLGMVEKAEEIMDTLRRLNLFSKSYAVQQMVLLYKNTEQWYAIKVLIKDARERKIDFDVHLYNDIIRSQRKQRNLRGMEKVFNQLLRDRKASPNAWSYVFMASGYIGAGLYHRAKEFLWVVEDGLEKRRFKKLRLVYNKMLVLYGNMKDICGVERMWAVVGKRPFLTLHNRVFMIDALGKIGKVGRAEEIFDGIRKEGNFQQERHYVAMIGVYCRQGMMDKAIKLIPEIPKKRDRCVKVMYNHLIYGYLSISEADKALDMFDEGRVAVKCRWNRLWYETTLVVLDVYAHRGDVICALKVVKYLLGRRARSFADIRIFNILLEAYLRIRIVPPKRVYDSMKGRCFVPDSRTKWLMRRLKPLIQERKREREQFLGTKFTMW